MSDLSRGYTFADGNTYPASALNSLVDNGTILPGAITGKTDTVPATADSFLYYRSASADLRQCTLWEIIGAFPTDAAPANASLRTLGTGATQAAVGNDARFPATVTGIRLGNGAGADTAAAPKDLTFAPVNLSGGGNINWDLGDIFYDTLTGVFNSTYTFSNVRAGHPITVVFKTAGYTGTIYWPTLFGTVPAQNMSATVHYYTFINTALGTSGLVKAI